MPAGRAQVLPRIGALVEGPGAYPHLSGRANLALLDASGADRLTRGQRRTRIGEVLDQVGLDPSDRRPVRTYSLGMRQRLGLAAALLRRPQLLVLDEPTNGLDPQGIQEIRPLLLQLNRAGTTIFLSSHLLAEVEQMCTRVGVLDRGRLVLQDDLDALLRPTGYVDVRTPDARRCLELLGSVAERIDHDRVRVRAADSAALNAHLVGQGIAVLEIDPAPADLEEVVLEASPLDDGVPIMIGVELVKLLRRPRTWLIIAMLVALPTLVAMLLAVTDLGAPARHRTAVPVRGAQRRHPLPAGRAGRGAAAVPADRGRGARRRRHRGRESRPAPCATCWSDPSGGPTCCSAKLITVVAFVVLAVLVVAAVSYVEGRLLLGRSPAGGTTTSLSGTYPHPGARSPSARPSRWRT